MTPHTPRAVAVDYDVIASGYNDRYHETRRLGELAALRGLIHEIRARRILEVGCGTAFWLAALCDDVAESYGLDLSAGMLAEAQRRPGGARLLRGRASRLPFYHGAFDLVYCVNALHHFTQQVGFIAEARRLLRTSGALAILGMDPHGRRDHWYVYTYFDGAYETDLARFPTWDTVLAWMQAQGLERVMCSEATRFEIRRQGRAVFDDPFIKKHNASQLALLSDTAYAKGLQHIEDDIRQAEEAGTSPVFRSDIIIDMLVGYAP
ncbi:MAG: class I SAM-dependent methyltransferase [Anaerolineae bacterium]|nr:class I SAM-dependent methyltransferase [Anaerolineae bacterium]